MTPKEKKAAYYKKNKEKIIARNEVWRKANQDRVNAKNKLYLDSKKDGLYTVYFLPKENYVGQTHNLYKRLIEHRYTKNRDTTGVEVLGKYKTREQAMKVEADYHSKGYLGAYNNL